MRILPQGRSIVFASRSAKQALLTKQRENKVFSNLKIFDYKQLFGWVSDRFFFYMHKNHGLNYTMSLKILKYLDFIEIDKDYQSSKLSQMKKIKMGLMNDGIYQPFAFEMYESFPLFSVSKMPVPWMFKQTVEPLESFERANEPVRLIETNSDMDACHAVYEEVSRLLENHVSPDNIKILNANATDLFQLQKLFRDAGIPLCIHHQNPLTNYPSIQYLIKILDNDGFDVFLEALDSRKDELIIKPLIDLVNRYPNELLKANIALFKEMISSLKSPRELVEGAVTTLSLSEVDFDKDTYHLLMNYSDEGLVPYQKHHDYLEVFEAMELGYFSLEEINSHLQEDYLYILESLEQLTLVFSKFSEHENRLPDLELHRDIIRIAYHYTVKEKSHLKTLDVLDYAKAEYDYQTYFLERDDHYLLYATYHSSVNRYHHQFSGINQEDLDHLIASHNTLTGAKIESYHLCKFQYLMKYLLKLGRNEPSIHTFLGSLTHKVFEEALKENHEPINDIIAFHLDFPEDEKYKEKVFRNALTEEIKKLL
nr:PD-(D/E)XK nuclease family protein [Bacillota bacterium]